MRVLIAFPLQNVFRQYVEYSFFQRFFVLLSFCFCAIRSTYCTRIMSCSGLFFWFARIYVVLSSIQYIANHTVPLQHVTHFSTFSSNLYLYLYLDVSGLNLLQQALSDYTGLHHYIISNL